MKVKEKDDEKMKNVEEEDNTRVLFLEPITSLLERRIRRDAEDRERHVQYENILRQEFEGNPLLKTVDDLRQKNETEKKLTATHSTLDEKQSMRQLRQQQKDKEQKNRETVLKTNQVNFKHMTTTQQYGATEEERRTKALHARIQQRTINKTSTSKKTKASSIDFLQLSSEAQVATNERNERLVARTQARTAFLSSLEGPSMKSQGN